MNNFDPVQTLEQRLSAGPLSTEEALRIASLVADRLRQVHEQGRAHGALTPAAIALGAGVQLQPPSFTAMTPYTAPEVLEGRQADPRSDIFAWGAIFYEMLTGRRAFSAARPPGSAAPASGNAEVDRLLAGCLAKSPDARFHRVQKLQLEVKLLMTASRRGAPELALGPVPTVTPIAVLTPVSSFVPAPEATPASAPAETGDTQLPAQMQELEARMAHRFAEQERAVASVERVANEVLKALRGQPAPLTSGRSSGRLFADVHDGEPGSRVERALEMLNDRIARLDLIVGTAVERLQKLEENLDAFDTDAAALRDSVTRDVRNFERVLTQHSSAIESARTAMGQTDDLVERVVEALDSLQSMFVTDSGERTLAS
jgi:eukaryotic-like serine/threonine-protein kinase